MIFSSYLKGIHTFFRQTFHYAYFFPLPFFLFLKILHLVLYLRKPIMIGLLLPLFFKTPNLCDLYISSFMISSPIFRLIVSITSSSVFSFFNSGRLWISKQFLLEYCSCLSEQLFKDSIVADISLRLFCSSLIIFSFSARPCHVYTHQILHK